MRRVFLDIGAYNGITTTQVLASTYRFDRFYCFEPQAFLCQQIRQIHDPRITVCQYGLGKTTGPATFYRGSTLAGASIYPGKRFRGPVRELDGDLVAAGEWFREHLSDDDIVIARMNCEGAECDILEDLFASGEYRKLSGLAVVFDIQKVPGHGAREGAVRERLSQIPKVFIMTDKESDRWGDAYLERWMSEVWT
jgi:FkbM family methyltransferase